MLALHSFIFVALLFITTTVLAQESSSSNATLLIRVKQGADWSQIAEILQVESEHSIRYNYTIISGYAVDVPHSTAQRVASVQSEYIEYVEDDIQISLEETQTDAPWGLQRISQRDTITDYEQVEGLDFTYNYDADGGSGVQVYVIDTGIRASHDEFGGRASEGPSFGYPSSEDGNGHGTHVAGISVGSQYGVAKSAEIIGVKALSDDGAGSVSDILAALQYVVDQKRENPSQAMIINMSMGGQISLALDDAISAVINAGVHVVVAAGNDNVNACTSSPARVSTAITVASMNIDDEASYFSNYGNCVDVWAPGENITSAWADSDSSAMVLSGTSMATPHISGLVAYLISLEGDGSPSEIQNRLVALETHNKLEVESGPDGIAFNGYQSSSGMAKAKRRIHYGKRSSSAHKTFFERKN